MGLVSIKALVSLSYNQYPWHVGHSDGMLRSPMPSLFLSHTCRVELYAGSEASECSFTRLQYMHYQNFITLAMYSSDLARNVLYSRGCSYSQSLMQGFTQSGGEQQFSLPNLEIEYGY